MKDMRLRGEVDELIKNVPFYPEAEEIAQKASEKVRIELMRNFQMQIDATRVVLDALAGHLGLEVKYNPPQPGKLVVQRKRKGGKR